MASSLARIPTQCCITLIAVVSISVFAGFDICDARSSLEILKPRNGLKFSYHYTEADDLDLPPLDAYGLEPSPSISLPPLGHGNSIFTPSPLATSPISNPPEIAPSPYDTFQTSNPPDYQHNPTHSDPVGPHFGPTQPMYPQPMLQPAGAPRHSWGPDYAVWCVARPTIPEQMIQRAMDYACGNGADCGSIKPNGPCFVPNNLVAHASYAFNSYWQRTKIAGGTCDFGGTATLITVDPSFHTCHFVYN